MPAERDARLVKYTKTDWTLFTVFYGLREQTLQTDFLLRRDLDRCRPIIFSLLA